METFGFTTCVGKTKLTSGKATYSARVRHNDIVRDEALVQGLAAETGYSTTIVGTVVEGIRTYLCNQLKVGNKVDFGAFSVGLSVRGSFPSANAPFDPKENSVGIDIRAGADLRKAVEGIVPDNVTDTEAPRITGILSFAHQGPNNYFKIMRGDPCNMVGLNFGTRFMGDGDGVWLESRSGEKVAMLRVTKHVEGWIGFVLDEDVPLGEYWLVVGSHQPGRPGVAMGRRLVQVVSTLG